MKQHSDRQRAINLIALLSLIYHLTPADLEAIAHQLAQFDAICDHRTQGATNVTSH